MAYTGNLRISGWIDNDTPIELTISESAGQVIKIDESWATATSDQEIAIAFLRAKLKMVRMSSDYAITIETNATDHAGGDEFVLVANEPVIWWDGCLLTNPFTQNVTKMYLTNASGSTARFRLEAVIDPT